MTDRNTMRGWCHLAPDRSLVGLLTVQLFLPMSEHFGYDRYRYQFVFVVVSEAKGKR